MKRWIIGAAVVVIMTWAGGAQAEVYSFSPNELNSYSYPHDVISIPITETNNFSYTFTGPIDYGTFFQLGEDRYLYYCSNSYYSICGGDENIWYYSFEKTSLSGYVNLQSDYSFVVGDEASGDYEIDNIKYYPYIYFSGYSSATTNLNQDSINLYINQNPPTVPEPASWALMVVGLGGLGLALRRRRRARSLLLSAIPS